MIARLFRFNNNTRRFIRLYSSSATGDKHCNTSLSSFSISQEIKQNLQKNGISELFPVQVAVFDPVMSGKNIIAKAHTGTGKTFAFLLPIVQKLLSSSSDNGFSFTRKPKGLIVCPTRELANQVHNEIPKLSQNIKSVCLHGGVSYTPQVRQLDRGVDIVVGTPGRLLDLVKMGNLSLTSIETLVLDESDLMLDIGFKQEVETILKSINDHKGGHSGDNGFQTLLFSATIPPWVKQLQSKYLGGIKGSEFIDLVGDETSQANANIRYLAISCSEPNLKAVLVDVLRVHATPNNAKSLVFVDRRSQADETTNFLAGYMNNIGALHGGIDQKDRDRLLASFRKGNINCLVATDVAARGIDISEVEIVVQSGLPGSVETFLHRSGRTGRAGRTGTCITFYDPLTESQKLRDFERQAKIQFERQWAPTLDQVMGLSLASTLEKLNEFDSNDLTRFNVPAKKILENLNAEDAVSALLCLCTNAQGLKDRSVITGQPGWTSLEFKCNRHRKIIDMGDVEDFLKFTLKQSSNYQIYQMHNDRERVLVDVVDRFADVLRVGSQRNSDPFVITTCTSTLTEVPEIRQYKQQYKQYKPAAGSYQFNKGGKAPFKKPSYQQSNQNYKKRNTRA